MSKKKILAVAVCAILAGLINVYIFLHVGVGSSSYSIKLFFDIELDCDDNVQVFFSENDTFSEEQSIIYNYIEEDGRQTVICNINTETKYIRIDTGSQSNKAVINDMYISAKDKKLVVDMSEYKTWNKSEDVKNTISGMDGSVELDITGGDPYVYFELDSTKLQESIRDNYRLWSYVFDAILCIIIDVIAFIAIRHINRLAVIPVELYNNRKLIGNLAKNDFKTKYAGSYLGVIWAFVQPIVMVVLYWFVFDVGLRAGRTNDYPYIVWLMAGLVPWFFFSEALNGGTNALIEYSYLVKKVVFKISILPLVKVISAMFVHVIFIGFVLILSWFYGYGSSVYVIQLIYYVFCNFIFVLGLTYMTSALVAFFRDLTQIINIVLQIGMWMTPIMWNMKDVIHSRVLEIIFCINPMYYIVDGFRDSLLAEVWFWDKPLWTVGFWIIQLVIFGLGITIFRRLRVHFADVL